MPLEQAIAYALEEPEAADGGRATARGPAAEADAGHRLGLEEGALHDTSS
jgi:hypothetical protein